MGANIRNRKEVRLVMLVLSVLAAAAVYLLHDTHPEKLKLFQYILRLRIPTLVCMMIASVSIGAPLRHLMKLAQYYNVSLDYLCGLSPFKRRFPAI